MIVKTGANYQAEGGYIEASKDGLEVTINDNGMKVVVPNISGNVESFIPASIRKSDDVSFDVTIFSVNSSATRIDGYNVGNVFNTFRICYKIGSTLAVTGGTPLNLMDGSKNCEIKSDPITGKQLLVATGDEPVAILGV